MSEKHDNVPAILAMVGISKTERICTRLRQEGMVSSLKLCRRA